MSEIKYKFLKKYDEICLTEYLKLIIHALNIVREEKFKEIMLEKRMNVVSKSETLLKITNMLKP